MKKKGETDVLISTSNDLSSAQSLPPHPQTETNNQPPSSGRLEQMAHHLATQHRVDPHPAAGGHLTQLPLLAKQLEDVHQHFVDAADQDVTSSSATEWLLDNYYMVVEALRQIAEDLPATYYRQLPKLTFDLTATDPPAPDSHAGQARVYAAASAFWTHEAYQLDQGRLNRFAVAYQQVQPFSMGELWALPTMLRLVLLETLAHAAQRSCERMLARNEKDRSPPEAGPAAVQTDDEVVANCIVSLRRVNNQDWSHFFEEVSPVHQILSQDAAAIYTRMDFASRNRYRELVERLSRATHEDETAVAQKAIDFTFATQTRATSAAGHHAQSHLDSADPAADRPDSLQHISPRRPCRLLLVRARTHTTGAGHRFSAARLGRLAPADGGSPHPGLSGRHRVAVRFDRLCICCLYRRRGRRADVADRHGPALADPSADIVRKPDQRDSEPFTPSANFAQARFQRGPSRRLPDDGGRALPDLQRTRHHLARRAN